MKYFIVRLIFAVAIASSTGKVAAEASLFLKDEAVVDVGDTTVKESHHFHELEAKKS